MANKTHKELVLVYHKNAKAVDIGTKKGGSYFNIIDETIKNDDVLGRGKSEANAWTAAYRNVYDHR